MSITDLSALVDRVLIDALPEGLRQSLDRGLAAGIAPYDLLHHARRAARGAPLTVQAVAAYLERAVLARGGKVAYLTVTYGGAWSVRVTTDADGEGPPLVELTGLADQAEAEQAGRAWCAGNSWEAL